MPENDADHSLTWTSSDNTVATIDDNGKVTALEVGKTTITTTNNNKTATCKITVVPKQIPEDMVFVEGGTFLMGNPYEVGEPNEWPQHQVTLSDFYIGKYEVTNAQYAKFLNAKGKHQNDENIWLDVSNDNCQIELVDGKYKVKTDKENYPVIMVTWYGAVAYAEWVGGRLPTEAEWEYAAKGGNKSQNYKYSGSDNIDEVAWYSDNSVNPDNNLHSEKGSHMVGTKKANELGIYDMSGNVAEWCNDWFSDYSDEAQTNPTGAESGRYRIVRGGNWHETYQYSRVTFRLDGYPTEGNRSLGLRIVILP